MQLKYNVLLNKGFLISGNILPWRQFLPGGQNILWHLRYSFYLMWSNMQDFNFLAFHKWTVLWFCVRWKAKYLQMKYSGKNIPLQWKKKRDFKAHWNVSVKGSKQNLDSELLADLFWSWKGIFFHGMWVGMNVTQLWWCHTGSALFL